MQPSRRDSDPNLHIASEDDMMQDQEERRSGKDRRAGDGGSSGALSDPRFVLQIIALVCSVAGGLLIAYVVSQTRTTALESAAANLNEKATKIEAQLNAIVNSVQSVSLETRTLQVEVKAREREIAESKGAIQMLEARIISLEKAISRLEASRER